MPSGIVSSLRRLRGLHLRLSLCRVTLASGCDGRLDMIDDRSLIAELAEDGSLVVIYIHPQGVSDGDAAGGVATRLARTLGEAGMPLRAMRITIVPCDATAIDEIDGSLAVMAEQPSRPLLSLVKRAGGS